MRSLFRFFNPSNASNRFKILTISFFATYFALGAGVQIWHFHKCETDPSYREMIKEDERQMKDFETFPR